MKNRHLHFIGTQAVRLVALALLLALTAASAMYLRGYFDLTFIDRVPIGSSGGDDTVITGDSDDSTPPPDTDVPGTDTEQGGTDTGITPDDPPVTNPPDTEEVTASSVIAALKKARALISAGYTNQTAGIYTAGKTVLANLGISGLGSSFSYSNYDARTVVTTEYERGCFYTEEVFVSTKRPAVLLRNGYIIRDVNGKLSLLNPNGTTVLSDYNEDEFVLTELRDKNGKPLFAVIDRVIREVEIPIMQKNEFTGRLEESGEFLPDKEKREFLVYTYYTLSEDGKWVLSDYTDERPHALSDVGLSFDAPLDYGESDCDIVRYYEYGSWGYKNAKTGRVLIYPRYVAAYNFHDGYAVAFDWYKMYFINEQGEVVYSVNYQKPEVFATYDEVTLPDTNGIEAIGTYYFSHGLTRIRFRENLETYQTWYYIKSDDRSVLYDIRGNEYPLPFGYTLEGYSDGVMLLRNRETGLYGYMNYKNEWILQPEYSYATPFISGLAAVGDANGYKGMIDTEGRWVLPQVFTHVSAPSCGMVALYEKSVGWQVLRMMSK